MMVLEVGSWSSLGENGRAKGEKKTSDNQHCLSPSLTLSLNFRTSNIKCSKLTILFKYLNNELFLFRPHSPKENKVKKF